MPAPSYGWLIGLTNFLNQNFPEKWAYTGSFAMYCIAISMGREARNPQDIDILTTDVSGVWLKVRKALNGNLSGPPGPKTQKCTIKSAKLYIADNSPVSVDIDVLKAGGKFGNLNDVRILHQGSTILRVASLQSMINAKQSIIGDNDDFDGKAATDLEFLRTLT